MTDRALDTEHVNVAARLSAMAVQRPDALAVVQPRAFGRPRQITFRELDDDSNLLASGLRALGVGPGTRLALLVPPSIEFYTLVFALLKSGAVSILIDPGMGRRNLVGCLAEAEPEGFVSIPLVHAVRTVLGKKFPKARFNVTVSSWGGITLSRLRRLGRSAAPAALTKADDPAAIIFTTGSTGPPKGVLYRHKTFDHQVTEIRDFYDIQPGEIDLPCFPLFGLFNCAMGVTTIIPRMDPTRPARVDPQKIVQAIDEWQVTQSFASPAVWNRVGPHCAEQRIRLPSLRRVMSAGAPVPVHVLASMQSCIHPEGDVHTPYGATEALPIASITAREVLGETSLRTAEGAGVCVGRRFPGIRWKVIRIATGPLATLAETEGLPQEEIGELIVSGPVVTDRYVTRTEINALAKIQDGATVWHRMGDVGYLDQHERFWFCGRLAHRVVTMAGPMYTIPCEAIFNRHASVFRSALVGIGPAGQQTPVIVVELKHRRDLSAAEQGKLFEELRALASSNPLTAPIEHFLIHPAFPVDIRHNAKIFREKLAVWAAARLGANPH